MTGLSFTVTAEVEDLTPLLPSSPDPVIVNGAAFVPELVAVIVHEIAFVPLVVNCNCWTGVGILNNPELSVSVTSTVSVPVTVDAVTDDETVILSSFTTVLS